MKKTTARTALVALTTATLFANSAMAEIKYWDNPDYREFKVSDYAPGAVWNFDGIDNAAGGSHSASATKWRNLGSSGANNDVWVRYQNSSGGWANSSAPSSLGGGMGSWAADGFKLTGGSEWRASGSGAVAQIDTGSNYTLQMLVTGKHSDQKNDKSFIMSVQQSDFAFYTDRKNKRLYWGTQNSSTASHPYISGDKLGYMTAILNGSEKTAAFFTGTKAPTSGSGFHQFSSVAGKTDNGYCIGGYTGTNGQFVGTIHSFRYYKRVLTDRELAWNRVVDEWRFFKRRNAPIPVTNVVVATSLGGANGTEPVGCYAVSGSHTFSAPANVDVGGVNYLRTGYTIETRKGGQWSEPVFHKTTLFQRASYVAKEGECVRLTWKWVRADGISNPLTVKDYVWKDLVVFYDGINNVATNRPHSYTATSWANLVSGGSANDVIVQRLNKDGNGWENAASLGKVDGRCPGRWTDDGFAIDGEGRFRCNAPGGFSVGTRYSLQMLVDAKASDQVTGSAFLLGANSNLFAFQLRKNDGLLIWKTGSDENPFMKGGAYSYMTAIMAGDRQKFFDGAVAPTSGDGYRKNANIAPYHETGYCLGGYGKELANDRFVGTFKSFRQYSRELTAAEIAKNRAVDNWRYFGIPDSTNVLVTSTHTYLQGNEPNGAYVLKGPHMFSAPKNAVAKGISYKCSGYTLEKWSANGWGPAESYATTTYTCSKTTRNDKVRLTWIWTATNGLRTASDYGFEDYSQAGIVWHFDGKLNRGLGATQNSGATTWKNLVPNSAPSSIFLQLAHTNGTSYVNPKDPLPNLGSVNNWNPGSWTAGGGGVRLYGHSRWLGLGQVGPVSNWTIQTLVDANVDNIVNKMEYVVSVSWSNFALALRKKDYTPEENCFYFNAQKADKTTSPRPYFQNESRNYDFATAILDSSDCTAKMFQGVIPPDSMASEGYYRYPSITSFVDTNFCIGASSTSFTDFFVGSIKNVRYYDRVLTEEEIVRNRNVDAVRYFGALGVTNVFVVAGGGSQAETGAYKVEGSWEFTATSVRDHEGADVPVARYVIETFADGRRESKEVFDGSSFTYSESDAKYRGKVVRLTWKPASPGTFLMLE